MNENRNASLLKNTSILGISSIATKLITFILIPLYTYCLNKSEYGIVDMLFTIGSVLIPLFTLNIAESIYRFSMDKNADNDKIVSISFTILLSCILSSLIIVPVVSMFPQYSDYKVYLYLYVVSAAFFQVLTMNLKGQSKLKLFGIGNILSVTFTAVLNILFLVVLKMKIEGYFLAYIISNVLVTIYAIIVGKVFNNLKGYKIDKKLMGEMVKYSIVLVPTTFMWWIINSSDRIMISNFIGNDANGIYAVSYKIPSIITSIATIFNQAWVFTAVDQKDVADKNEYTNQIFKSMYIIMFMIAITITTFLKPFMTIYVSKEFYMSWVYVPFLLFGSAFMTLGTFISSSYNVHKDSKGFLISGLIGAIINIVLNLVFIPKFGVYGAALATCISYISVYVYRIFDTKKYVRINVKKYMILPPLILLIDSILLYINNSYIIVAQIILFIIALAIYHKFIINIIKGIISMVFRKRLKKDSV